MNMKYICFNYLEIYADKDFNICFIVLGVRFISMLIVMFRSNSKYFSSMLTTTTPAVLTYQWCVTNLFSNTWCELCNLYSYQCTKCVISACYTMPCVSLSEYCTNCRYFRSSYQFFWSYLHIGKQFSPFVQSNYLREFETCSIANGNQASHNETRHLSRYFVYIWKFYIDYSVNFHISADTVCKTFMKYFLMSNVFIHYLLSCPLSLFVFFRYHTYDFYSLNPFERFFTFGWI
jgi:hypothetical protein